jgi:hypothetical protein
VRNSKVFDVFYVPLSKEKPEFLLNGYFINSPERRVQILKHSIEAFREFTIKDFRVVYIFTTWYEIIPSHEQGCASGMQTSYKPGV